MGKHVLTVIVAVIIGVSLLLYMTTYQVRSSETAIIMTFGNPSAEPPAPGYHFKAPWPIQQVRTFDNRVHVQEGRMEEMRTRDGYNLIISIATGWEIAEPLTFNKNFGSFADNDDKDAVNKQAWAALESIIRHNSQAVISNHSLNDLVTSNTQALQYDKIEEDILNKASASAKEQYGIGLVLAKIRRLELPESAKLKVFGRMISERELAAQAIQSKATEEANVIKSEAESERTQIVARANSEAVRIRGEGEAEAAKYYTVFNQDPELAIYLRQISALKNSTMKDTTIILDTTIPPFNVLVQDVPNPKTRPPALPPSEKAKP